MMHEEQGGRVSTRTYSMVGGAIILSLLIGLGIGVAIADDTQPEAEMAVPAAVEEIHINWFDAWNRADGEAAVAMMAPGARHYCPGSGTDGVSGGDLADFVDKGFSVADVELIGAISMGTPGEGPGESQDHVVVTQLTLDGHEGYISTLHLRGQEDALRVLSHRAFP